VLGAQCEVRKSSAQCEARKSSAREGRNSGDGEKQ
jgi:hypothetical protein